MNYTKAGRRKGRKRSARADAFRDMAQDAEPVIIEERDDPLATVIAARKRHNPAFRGDVRQTILSEPAGQAIVALAGAGEAGQRLWAIFLDYDRAKTVYFGRVLSQQRFPKVAKLEMMPERFEARDDTPPDLRSEEERIASAREAMNGWGKRLAELSSRDRMAVNLAIDRLVEVFKDGKPTPAGLRMVKALRELEKRS